MDITDVRSKIWELQIRFGVVPDGESDGESGRVKPVYYVINCNDGFRTLSESSNCHEFVYSKYICLWVNDTKHTPSRLIYQSEQGLEDKELGKGKWEAEDIYDRAIELLEEWAQDLDNGVEDRHHIEGSIH